MSTPRPAMNLEDQLSILAEKLDNVQLSETPVNLPLRNESHSPQKEADANRTLALKVDAARNLEVRHALQAVAHRMDSKVSAVCECVKLLQKSLAAAHEGIERRFVTMSDQLKRLESRGERTTETADQVNAFARRLQTKCDSIDQRLQVDHSTLEMLGLTVREQEQLAKVGDAKVATLFNSHDALTVRLSEFDTVVRSQVEESAQTTASKIATLAAHTQELQRGYNEQQTSQQQSQQRIAVFKERIHDVQMLQLDTKRELETLHAQSEAGNAVVSRLQQQLEMCKEEVTILRDHFRAGQWSEGLQRTGREVEQVKSTIRDLSLACGTEHSRLSETFTSGMKTLQGRLVGALLTSDSAGGGGDGGTAAQPSTLVGDSFGPSVVPHRSGASSAGSGASLLREDHPPRMIFTPAPASQHLDPGSERTPLRPHTPHHQSSYHSHVEEGPVEEEPVLGGTYRSHYGGGSNSHALRRSVVSVVETFSPQHEQLERERDEFLMQLRHLK